MTDRPILFSAPMVCALLVGRKTQTRRVLKLPTKGIYERKDMGGWAPTTNGGGGSFTIGRDGSRTPATETAGIWHQTTGRCLNAPYQVGDRLWVRETWAKVPSSAYRQSDGVEQTLDPADRDYAAIYAAGWDRSIPRWKPGIHMPRWASRTFLTVTDVRVQRLQEIDHHDAEAEGVDCSGPVAVNCYRALWDKLNAARGFSWDTNPWIVAVSFTVQRGNIDPAAGRAADRRPSDDSDAPPEGLRAAASGTAREAEQ